MTAKINRKKIRLNTRSGVILREKALRLFENKEIDSFIISKTFEIMLDSFIKHIEKDPKNLNFDKILREMKKNDLLDYRDLKPTALRIKEENIEFLNNMVKNINIYYGKRKAYFSTAVRIVIYLSSKKSIKKYILK